MGPLRLGQSASFELAYESLDVTTCLERSDAAFKPIDQNTLSHLNSSGHNAPAFSDGGKLSRQINGKRSCNPNLRSEAVRLLNPLRKALSEIWEREIRSR